ncbi:MAG: HAD family hydrolase [Sedimenticolaceae bacterium]
MSSSCWTKSRTSPIKASSPDAIAALHAEGIQLVMLTGDSRTTAQAVADQLGIDRVEAEVLPDQDAAGFPAAE